jgi:hypothetical protein
MKKAHRIPVVLLAAFGLTIALAAYAAGDATCEPGAKHRRHRMYDSKTVETISGEVIKAEKIPFRRGKSDGVRLLLKTDKEEIPVSLGPSRYLDAQDVKIGEKDRIEVKGSRVTGKRGKTFLLAAQIKKGDALLKLRDENGKPLWAGKKER